MDQKNELLITIEPVHGFVNLNIKEIWNYHELLFTLAVRDLKVRYSQTLFGVLWAIFPPFVSMIIFSIFFGTFAKISSNNIPYPVFVFVGTLIWNYFSNALSNASNSLVAHRDMLQKVYFPKIILTLSPIFASLFDLIIASGILFLLMIYYNILPNIEYLLVIPFLLIILVLTTAGLGALLSAINVKYRDIGQTIPFIIQIGLFVTPVIYPLSITNENWRFILGFNPLTSVIETARVSLLGSGNIDYSSLGFSIILSIIIFLIGMYVFAWFEKDFADLV